MGSYITCAIPLGGLCTLIITSIWTNINIILEEIIASSDFCCKYLVMAILVPISTAATATASV